MLAPAVKVFKGVIRYIYLRRRNPHAIELLLVVRTGLGAVVRHKNELLA